jgi:hypothetical protein
MKDLSLGQLVFTKTVSQIGVHQVNKSLVEVQHKPNHGKWFMSILVGCCEGDNLPDNNTFKHLIFNSGLVTHDDIVDVLGQETLDKICKHIETKYEVTPCKTKKLLSKSSGLLIMNPTKLS